MTLALYLSWRFAKSFLIVAASFWGILFLIDIVEEIRHFAGDGLSLAQIGVLAALKIPETLYHILPLIVMLSAVALFIALARSSELVVIRAAGRSALRMLVAPMGVALILGLLALLIGNPLVSATSKRYDALLDHYKLDGGSTVSIGREGVWMRQSAGVGANGQAQAQAVIHAARANSDATTLYDVTFLIFDPERGPVRRINASTAQLAPGEWRLSGVKDWPLGSSTNPERDAKTEAKLTLPSDLTEARIRDSFGKPSAVPIWQLPSFIASLEGAGFSARRHLVWFHMELALPVMLIAMVLIAASFTMDPARSGGTGLKVLLALGAGLGLFFLRNIAQVLGDNGEIPVLLAAWAPPVIGLLLPLARLLHREDG
ncbi:LPS export ABC transporter permease LptG [Thioclava atlantica]|uniref:Permease YjgP/YjgQ family protein n=1 Tax=Thioclava atlantica TaxID=1317124 RepID=A0A085TWC3_9RHOB|nr:LPS export ABC transporter permease LptG [Thioclava atlantica]KFE35020.1 permease YjgP/YjgQ family protein [Thioclava atlantica]